MDHNSDSENEEDDESNNFTHLASSLHLNFQSQIPSLYLPIKKKKIKSIAIKKLSLKKKIQLVQSKFTAAQLLCLRMEFNAFDADASNTIDVDELRAIVDSLGGHHIHSDELKKVPEYFFFFSI